MLKLKEGDLNERVHAAKRLAKTRDASVVEALMAALEDDEFVSRGDSSVAPVRDAAERSLAKLGSVAVDSVLVALNSDAPDVRERAARCLGQIGDARAVDPLVAALGDSESRVRQAVIGALGQLGKLAADSLRTAAEKEDPIVRVGAGEALALVGDPSAADIFTTVLETGDLPARKQAAHALGKCGGEKAVGPLMNALKDDDAELRALAEQSLVSLRKTQGDPFLGQIFPVTVNYGDELAELLRAGRYDRVAGGKRIPFPSSRVGWRGPDGAVEHYPKEGTVELEMSLVIRHEHVMNDIEQAQERLAELGLRAANVHELLSFGAAYPEIQASDHIYAIGSSAPAAGASPIVPYLWGIPSTLLSAGTKGLGGGQRFVDLTPFDKSPLGENHRYVLATPVGRVQ